MVKFKHNEIICRAKQVIHTMRDLIMMDEVKHIQEEGKLQPKRHIFYPDFAVRCVLL